MNHEEIKAHIINHRCTAAYLGRVQMGEMIRDARHVAYTPGTPLRTPRLKYAGCRLYEVDAESHIGFADYADVKTPE